MIKDQMERIYRNIPVEEIPWNIESPPAILQSLADESRVMPCKAIELGCGTGHYVAYLASRGFDVTGVDISSAAIEIAKNNAANKGATCDFVVADVLGDLAEVRGPFDFAYDWELLHHIFPSDRKRYVGNVHRLLGPEGRYLSVCFSEKSPHFGGIGKYRRTPLGTVLYFSSEEEMVSLFQPMFEIKELKTVDIPGKVAVHKAIYAFMTKRE